MTIDPIKQHLFLSRLCETESLRETFPVTRSVTQSDIENAWRNLPITSGNVVIVMLPNSAMLLRHIFALLNNGYVPALLAPSTPTARLNLIAQALQATAIIKNKFMETGDALESCAQITKIIDQEVMILNNSVNPHSKAGEIILGTSGTTGINSGCVFDFNSLLLNAQKHIAAIGMHTHDTVLVTLPMYYSYAFVAQALACYVSGAKLVISGPPFNSKQYVHDLAYYQITVSSVTPLLIKELLTNNAAFPDCLRILTIGGDHLEPRYISTLLENKKNLEIYITYGITQAGPRVATLSAHAVPDTKYGSVGQLLPGTEMLLEKSDDTSHTGELLVCSDTLAKRCLGDSHREIFVERNNKRWLKTGDLFSVDHDGYLYFKSRTHDLVIFKGEKVNLHAIKLLLFSEFPLLSIKTILLKEGPGLIGYYLDILVGKNFNKTIDDIQNFINKTLRTIEKPQYITLSEHNHLNVERYK